jgi:hypothetical protein
LFVPAEASQPIDTYAYAVAAVFCPSMYKGMGYGKQLMRLLHYVFAHPEYLPPLPGGMGTTSGGPRLPRRSL